MRLLVAGCTGFVGSHLLPVLKPGELLDHGSTEQFPHKVYEVWWPRARAESFQIA